MKESSQETGAGYEALCLTNYGLKLSHKYFHLNAKVLVDYIFPKNYIFSTICEAVSLFFFQALWSTAHRNTFIMQHLESSWSERICITV